MLKHSTKKTFEQVKQFIKEELLEQEKNIKYLKDKAGRVGFQEFKKWGDLQNALDCEGCKRHLEQVALCDNLEQVLSYMDTLIIPFLNYGHGSKNAKIGDWYFLARMNKFL